MTLWFPQVSHYPRNLIWLHIITVSSLGKQEWNVYHGKGCNAAIWVDCWTINRSRLFSRFFKSLFRCWLKNIYNWHSVNDVLYWKHLTYFSTSIILMNKAQNAQIQVNSHVIFTVYCHYLHDLKENSHITQHRQHDCTTVRFSETLSVRPIRNPFTSPSFVFCFVLFFYLGGRRS